MTTKRLSTFEFIALMAMLFATIAFSIDAMLPALPAIGDELTPDDINQAQLIITSFVFGMGVGTLFVGPLSDAFGRKAVLLVGVGAYITASWFAWQAESLEFMLLARFFQGLGVAAPRVVGLAVIRDLYSGKAMAKIMSFTMLVFAIVPALAPLAGSIVIYYLDWRAIFLVFIVFATVSALWFGLRQSETLPREDRIPFRFSSMQGAFLEVIRNEMFVLTTLVQAAIFGLLMSLISTIQQTYDLTFDEGGRFPLWFAVTALLAATASAINAAFVGRFGMRALIRIALGVELILSVIMVGMTVGGFWPEWAYLPAYFLWTTSIFFILGFTLGNLNALALEPLGHIAGMAASITGSLSTILAVAIAIPIGLAFDNTPLPVAIGGVVCTGVGSLLMRRIARLERIKSVHVS